MAPQTEAMQALAAGGPVADIGAGGRVIAPGVITVDSCAHPGTRVVADILRLPFRGHCLAGLICTGTLEHVADPWSAVGEFARVLRPDGLAHVEVPFMQPYHADPHDYWRFTGEGLDILFGDWRVVASGSHMGSGAGAAWVLTEAVKGRFAPGSILRRGLHLLLCLLVQPLRLLDRPGRPGDSASGYFLRARPPLGGEPS